MIRGHGVDIEEISRVQKVYEKNTHFAERVLTEKELRQFFSLSQKRKMEFLTGRWAAKEAFSKALGTGIGRLTFQDIEVSHDQKGAPYFSRIPFCGKSWLSISHTESLAMASVILEEEENES